VISTALRRRRLAAADQWCVLNSLFFRSSNGATVLSNGVCSNLVSETANEYSLSCLNSCRMIDRLKLVCQRAPVCRSSSFLRPAVSGWGLLPVRISLTRLEVGNSTSKPSCLRRKPAACEIRVSAATGKPTPAAIAEKSQRATVGFSPSRCLGESGSRIPGSLEGV